MSCSSDKTCPSRPSPTDRFGLVKLYNGYCGLCDQEFFELKLHQLHETECDYVDEP